MKRLTEIKFENAAKAVNHGSDALKKSIFADLIEKTDSANIATNVGVDKLIYQKITSSESFKQMQAVVNDDSTAAAYATCNFLVEGFRKSMKFYKKHNPDSSDSVLVERVAKNLELKQEEAVDAVKTASDIEQQELQDGDGCGSGADSSSGSIGSITLDQKLLNLIARNDKNDLARFAEVLGRLEQACGLLDNQRGLRGMRTQNIDMSDDISRVLTSELAYLSDDDCEDLFYDDYQNSQLLSWEEEGEAETGNGNLIILLDISGSMNHPFKFNDSIVTDRVMLAKAICYNIIKDRRDKQDVLMQFNYNVVDEQELKDKTASGKLLDILNIYCRGGTSFLSPLARAQTIVDDKPDLGYDILLITDACIDPDDEAVLQKYLGNNKHRVFSLVINDYMPEVMNRISRKAVLLDTGRHVEPQLEKLADLILEIEDETNQEAVA